MSISRALKRPRSYMEGPRSGKTNCKKFEENVYGRMLPVAASPKRGGGGGAPPLPLFPVPSARAGVFLYIYLSISTYLSLYII